MAYGNLQATYFSLIYYHYIPYRFTCATVRLGHFISILWHCGAFVGVFIGVFFSLALVTTYNLLLSDGIEFL